jgi:hypothetical protein
VFAQNAIYNLDMAAFYTKWARDIRDDQHPDGRFADISPRNGNNRFIGAPGWADAGVIVPWRVYENYGDTAILADSLDSMKRFVDYVHANNPDLRWKKKRFNDFGDWLHGSTFQNPPDAYPKKKAELPKDVFATGYFYYSASLTAETAKVLGKTADYEKYSKLAADIKAAFNKAYVAPDGKVKGDNQAAYALVLALHLVPDNLRANAAKRLVDDLQFYGGRLSTGFHSTIWMMKELSENGYTDVAYKLLLSRRFPSWFYSIDNGATTIWERWDGYVKGRGFQSAGMNSFNHYSLGAVGEWMYAYLLGIKRDAASPGWRHFFIAPQPGGDLTWAKGSYRAITGKIEVSWKLDAADDTFALDAVVPANTTATVVLPFGGGTHEIGSGNHAWKIPANAKKKTIVATPLLEDKAEINTATLAKWSAPYRGWTYHADPIIPADFKVPGTPAFHSFDCPCVYQLPGKPDTWYMSFIGFNGKGYNSFVVESTDLIHWKNPQLALGFGAKGEFDFGGGVIGAFLYESWDVNAPRTLKKKDGKYWTLYGAYPKQGGYELRPGYEGIAESDDGIHWRRASAEPILSVFQSDRKAWEKDCIYQPWLVEHNGTYYNFYNAASGSTERSGIALSTDLFHWVRYPFNPVLEVRRAGYDARFASDPKVFRDGDHWTMIYFGVGKGGASIMAAFSRDLLHWTADPVPLYKFGGHPTGLDKQYAHKISLVFNPGDNTFYMYYCAVGNKGRTIGLLKNTLTR